MNNNYIYDNEFYEDDIDELEAKFETKNILKAFLKTENEAEKIKNKIN